MDRGQLDRMIMEFVLEENQHAFKEELDRVLNSNTQSGTLE